MRHVILGANSFVGTFVLKLLVTIGEGIKIIAVSPTGKIDEGIIRDNIIVKTGDILNLKDMYDVFEKDDIIYNTQVIFDETHNISEVELVNYAGLINILGIARITGVSRIVSVLPQFEGSKEFCTEFHNITKKTTNIIKNYFARNEFGWSSKAIRVWAKKNITDFKIPIKFYEDEFDEEEIEEEIVQNKPSGPQAPKSTTPSLSGPQAPKLDIIIDQSLAETRQDETIQEIQIEDKDLDEEDSSEINNKIDKSDDDTTNDILISEDEDIDVIENNSEDEDIDVIENNSEDDIPKSDEEVALEKFWERQKNETEKRKKIKLKLEAETKKQEKIREKERKMKKELRRRELPKAKLAVARLGRIFGSYDNTITVEYCDSVRRGKLTVNGEINKQISWITPIDIGRALIILGDKTVPTGEYNMNSFIASPLEIIKQLDKQNHSKTAITHLDIKKELWKIKINNLLTKIGIGQLKETVPLFKYNVEQVFPDTEARNRWKWYPRYDFQKAIEDAFLWYIEVMVPIIYNIEIK